MAAEYKATETQQYGPARRVYYVKDEAGADAVIDYNRGKVTISDDGRTEEYRAVECYRAEDRLTFWTHAGDLIAAVDMAEVAN